MLDPVTVAAIALKTSLLLVVVGLIVSLMARHSAAWRHFLWTAALTLALLMPFAVVYLPSSIQISLPRSATESWTRDEPAPVASGTRRAEAEAAALAPRDGGRSIAEGDTREAWPIAMIVWLVGAIGVLLRNAMAHVGLFRWARQARSEHSPAWSATLSRVARETGLRRPLRVLESERTTSPCTWGVLRPVLLLPAAGADWPEPQRRFVLLHELAHVRRFDYLTTQVANLTCAMHWYNPFVWFAAARARKLQEQACDDAVLGAGGAPSDYAELLVAMAGGSRRLSLAFPAAVGMVQRSQLHGRVTAILDASRTRLPLSGIALLIALVPLASLTLFLAIVSAVATPAAMQRGIPLTAAFNSVELRNGGNVSLVHGESQSVTLLKGDPEQASISIRDDGRLVIDRCPTQCPRNHDFEVEVVTPALGAIAVAEGGTIQARGEFPPQSKIVVAVSQGGRIDIRSIPVANVTASVYSGGGIFTKPGTALRAKVEQGGNITYWGDAVVESSVLYGGVVEEGTAADADRSLADLIGPKYVEPPAPIPPVPPVPRVQSTSR